MRMPSIPRPAALLALLFVFTGHGAGAAADTLVASVVHGMPSTSERPTPAWYAQRYNLPRGLGEAIVRAGAGWDEEHRAFAYYSGGVFYAWHDNWRHQLTLRTDNKGEPNTVCGWDENGALTTEPPGGEGVCEPLLQELARTLQQRGSWDGPVG